MVLPTLFFFVVRLCTLSAWNFTAWKHMSTAAVSACMYNVPPLLIFPPLILADLAGGLRYEHRGAVGAPEMHTRQAYHADSALLAEHLFAAHHARVEVLHLPTRKKKERENERKKRKHDAGKNAKWTKKDPSGKRRMIC